MLGAKISATTLSQAFLPLPHATHAHLGDLDLVLLLALLQVGEVMPGAVKVHHLPVALGDASLRRTQINNNNKSDKVLSLR